jgi:hypothetical protein
MSLLSLNWVTTRRCGFSVPRLLCFAVPFLLAAAGCKKESPSENSKAPKGQTVPAGETVLRAHWLGKQRISAETNSGYFTGIWTLPESQKLEARILDQLASAPIHLLTTNYPTPPPSTNSSATLNSQLSTNFHASARILRPLLDDLVVSEVYLEVAASSNVLSNLGLAIRMDEQRAALWKSNLPQAFAALTNDSSFKSQASTFPFSPLYSHLEIFRSGDWTYVGLGPQASALIHGLEAQMAIPPKNTAVPWLQVDVRLSKLKDIFAAGLSLPLELPEMHMLTFGSEQGITTKAVFEFAKPLPFEIEPWNLPTNIMFGPLNTFTAIQGLRSLLPPLKFWNDLNAGPPPNELASWAHVAHPALAYAAAPLPNAGNVVAAITNVLLTTGNEWMTNHASGEFTFPRHGDGIFCTAGNPLFGAFLRTVNLTNGAFVYTGLGDSDSTNILAPPALLHEVAGKTNVLYYDWEVTAPRVLAGFYMLQGVRVIFWKAQLPSDCPAMAWLQGLGQKLGNCVTRVTKTGPNQLTLDRNSSVGLNSTELGFLADWLESPIFPRGTYTMVVPGPGKPQFGHKRAAAAPEPGKK